MITPRHGLRDHKYFTVVVDYVGEPSIVVDPDEALEGWVPTEDGAFVVGEPQGSPGWYPANDTPRDKALVRLPVTVARTGSPSWRTASSSPRTSARLEDDVDVGRGRPDGAVPRDGDGRRVRPEDLAVGAIPNYVAVDPTLGPQPVLEKIPAIVRFFEGIYGRYPFNAVGAIVDDANDVGYALETQTKPVFDPPPDEATLVHEIAHMWVGDSVTLSLWPDIWLHEGFATWSEWIWSERTGGESAAAIFDELYAIPATNTAFWTPPPGNPGGPELLFDGTIYDRGGMTLQALREKIGDWAFFGVLRQWTQRNKDGNVSTPEFVALAEHISHRNLGRFFNTLAVQAGEAGQLVATVLPVPARRSVGPALNRSVPVTDTRGLRRYARSVRGALAGVPRGKSRNPCGSTPF